MYKNYQFIENEGFWKYRIKDPSWAINIVDLSFWGGLKNYVDAIEWETIVDIEAVEDTTTKDTYDNTEVILKTIANMQKQIICIANEQEKLIKLVSSIKSKWTAKN